MCLKCPSTLKTRLKPAQQMIKYFLTFLSRTYRYCPVRLTAAARPALRQSYRRAYDIMYTLFVTVQFNLICVHFFCSWVSNTDQYKGSTSREPVSEMVWKLSQVFVDFEIMRLWKSKEVVSNTYCKVRSSYLIHTHTHTHTGWRKKNACFWICLRFLSLGLPQIKSLRSKTPYSRRSESFHTRRNCNCATRNVSKCDAELWGEAPDVCTARRTPSFRYNFP